MSVTYDKGDTDAMDLTYRMIRECNSQILFCSRWCGVRANRKSAYSASILTSDTPHPQKTLRRSSLSTPPRWAKPRWAAVLLFRARRFASYISMVWFPVDECPAKSTEDLQVPTPGVQTLDTWSRFVGCLSWNQNYLRTGLEHKFKGIVRPNWVVKALVPSGDGQRRRGGLEVSSRNPRWWFKGKDEVAYSFAALRLCVVHARNGRLGGCKRKQWYKLNCSST